MIRLRGFCGEAIACARRLPKQAVLKLANGENRRRDGEPLRVFSEDNAAQRRTLFGHVLRATPDDPMRQAADHAL